MNNRCKTANQCYIIGVMYCSFHNDAIDILILNKWWYFFCISFIEDIYLSIYNGKQINDVMSDKISLIFFAFYRHTKQMCICSAKLQTNLKVVHYGIGSNALFFPQ